MKVFVVENRYPLHSTSYIMNETPQTVEMSEVNLGAESPSSVRSKHLETVKEEVSVSGSESPRSIRAYHKGNGSLQGGGVEKIYQHNRPSMKKYKSKLDARLGFCLFFCFLIIATVLCIYGIIHRTVHEELTVYVNRTHQIAHELKLALDENYIKENSTGFDSQGRKWMTEEELETDAYFIREANSTVWSLFWWNVVFCVLLSPCLVAIHCNVVEGNLAKLAYRIVLLVCLIFCLAQVLYLIHPLLWAAAKFPDMVDRLFVNAMPRDEYHITSIQDRFNCLFQPHETLVQLDLQTPCLPKLKNSLFPTYSVVFLIIVALFPFIYAIFVYFWSSCIKDSSVMETARRRVELNNARRVPFPKTNVYIPPADKNVKSTPYASTYVEELPGKLV